MAAAPAPVVKGYLILTVEEATGRAPSASQFTWDTNTGDGRPFEAFVKGTWSILFLMVPRAVDINGLFLLLLHLQWSCAVERTM